MGQTDSRLVKSTWTTPNRRPNPSAHSKLSSSEQTNTQLHVGCECAPVRGVVVASISNAIIVTVLGSAVLDLAKCCVSDN
jgi:hypothetical protein